MRVRPALAVGLVFALGLVTRGGEAAPTVPVSPVKDKLPAPSGPPAACLQLNPDQKVDLGTDVSRTVSTPAFPPHAGCPDAFIADFEAGPGARGVNVRPAAVAPQSWLDTFSLAIWDGREVPGGDSLKVTSIGSAKLCAAFKQSLYVYRKAVPTEAAFTLVAGGDLRAEWSDNACWLRRPFNFRGQAGTATVKNVYRLVFVSPGGAGPVNVAFQHDGTTNGE